MPVYDYKCAACGAEFEVERRLGAAGKIRCAKCRSLRTEKIFSAAGVVFRGSGFYVTDSKPASGPAETGPKPPGGESAPAATGTAKPAPPAGSGSTLDK